MHFGIRYMEHHRVHRILNSTSTVVVRSAMCVDPCCVRACRILGAIFHGSPASRTPHVAKSTLLFAKGEVDGTRRGAFGVRYARAYSPTCRERKRKGESLRCEYVRMIAHSLGARPGVQHCTMNFTCRALKAVAATSSIIPRRCGRSVVPVASVA